MFLQESSGNLLLEKQANLKATRTQGAPSFPLLRTAQAWDGKDLSSSPQPYFFFFLAGSRFFPALKSWGLCFWLLHLSVLPAACLPLEFGSALMMPQPSREPWGASQVCSPQKMGVAGGVGAKPTQIPPPPWSPCTLRGSRVGASGCQLHRELAGNCNTPRQSPGRCELGLLPTCSCYW